MRKLIILLFILASMALSVSCTSQDRAKTFGGSTTVELKPGEKLINVTWKDKGSLWLLTEKAPAGHIPQTYTFGESARWGILEGKVVIKEQ